MTKPRTRFGLLQRILSRGYCLGDIVLEPIKHYKWFSTLWSRYQSHLKQRLKLLATSQTTTTSIQLQPVHRRWEGSNFGGIIHNPVVWEVEAPQRGLGAEPLVRVWGQSPQENFAKNAYNLPVFLHIKK